MSQEYEEYLDTEHWRKLRTRIRRRARRWCERCKVTGRKDIHHLTYDRLGHERLEDLIAVCRRCHEFLHGKRTKDPAAVKWTPDEVRRLREYNQRPPFFTPWEAETPEERLLICRYKLSIEEDPRRCRELEGEASRLEWERYMLARALERSNA